jgi:cytochrome c5
MGIMSAKAAQALLLCAAVASATTAVFAGQTTRPDKGEQILNGSCTTCHDLGPIQVQALDRAGWTGNVESMIQRGADVAKDDLPILIDYLVANHGPLPDGPGKNIVLNICTMCHDLNRVRRNLATREEWEGTLGAMLNEGAPLSEQDFPVVLNYLAKNFKPE